jgi:hypothetical protein
MNFLNAYFKREMMNLSIWSIIFQSIIPKQCGHECQMKQNITEYIFCKIFMIKFQINYQKSNNRIYNIILVIFFNQCPRLMCIQIFMKNHWISQMNLIWEVLVMDVSNIHRSSIISTLKVTLFEGFVVPYGTSISFFFQ